MSLSHTRGAVAAAAGWGMVGVDVENAADATAHDQRVARRVPSAAELRAVDDLDDPGRAFLQLWVRKEALIKVGEATVGTLRHTDVSAVAVPRGARGWSVGACADRHVLDWASDDGRLLAAAVAERRPALIEVPQGADAHGQVRSAKGSVGTHPNPERTRTHV